MQAEATQVFSPTSSHHDFMMASMLDQKTTAVPKLSYLHVSRFKKHITETAKNGFSKFSITKGSTFHLKGKKAI